MVSAMGLFGFESRSFRLSVISARSFWPGSFRPDFRVGRFAGSFRPNIPLTLPYVTI